MATKIAPVAKKETIDYSGNATNNLWKLRDTHNSSQSGHRERIMQVLDNIREGFVCIYSEIFTDKKMIETIFNLAERGVRFYILTNEYSQELDPLNGKALIRFSGVNNIGSFILANPNSNMPRGVFFGGQLTEPSLLIEHFSFNLKSEEIKELFRHFCYQFWENAKTEIIEKNIQKNVEPKPIDIYYDLEKFNGKDYVYGTLFDFIETTGRGNLSGQRIVYLDKEKQLPEEIKASSDIALGDNQMKQLLPKEEFEAQKPVFKDDGVSVQITYSWQNVPFYLPENAKRHNLYIQWETEKKKIDDYLSTQLTNIEDLAKKENTISKRITRFFLGKKTQFEELKRQIMELQKVDFPNITREDRDKKISSIKEISSSISSHSREIDNENRKALIDEEIEKLQQQVDAKKSELEQKEKDRSEKESGRTALNDELQSVSEKIKATDKEDKKAIEELSSKEKDLKDQIKQSGIFINKVEDDMKKIEKEIHNLENAIKSEETKKQQVDSQNEKAESSLTAFGSKKDKKHQNSTPAKGLEIQNLPQLPQTGNLFSANGDSFLAIENWEEYNDGKVEAERFKAKLCVIK